MKIYDTAIIGSGYTAMGYALKKGNSIIIEESETADVNFYLSLKNFFNNQYAPKNEQGKALLSLYESLNLFKGNEQNLNGFECGFCEFVFQNGLEFLFKTRVIDIQKENEVTKLSLITSGGIEYVYAKNVLDLTKSTPDSKTLTILYSTDCPTKTEELLKATFSGCVVENAFYDNRYAVRIPVKVNADFNDTKIEIFERWKKANPNAKILYFAPIFANVFSHSKDAMQDGYYLNPIEAFEYGVMLATNEKEGK